jgi:DNA-binding transcriptional LysR family regulator
MIQKLENDLNITLLDRSGHRAKFTDTGRMMLEKGRLLLNAAKDLEKQAVQLSAGWDGIWQSPWMTLSRLARCCR